MIVLGAGRVVAALASNRKPGEIAGAVAFAGILGLIPGGNLIWFAVLALSFFLKINLGIELLLIPVFSIIAGNFDPQIDQLGYTILTHESSYGLFSAWYNTPLIPLTSYNDTLVAGGLALGIALSPVLYLIGRVSVFGYRNYLHDRIANNPAAKVFAKSPTVAKIINAVRRLYSIGTRFR